MSTVDAQTTLGPEGVTTVTSHGGHPPTASEGCWSTEDVFSSPRSEAFTFVTGPSAVDVPIAPPTPSPTTTAPTIPT